VIAGESVKNVTSAENLDARPAANNAADSLLNLASAAPSDRNPQRYTNHRPYKHPGLRGRTAARTARFRDQLTVTPLA